MSNQLIYNRNTLSIDWFTFVSFVDDPEGVIKLLGLESLDWVSVPYAVNGYMYALRALDIIIAFGVPDGYGGDSARDSVCVSMSGSGCRSFEHFSSLPDCWYSIFTHCMSDPESYHVTRLDIAYDDYIGILNFSSLIDSKRNWLTHIRSRFHQANTELIEKGAIDPAFTLYFGSKKSELYFRIYDKAKEQHVDYHWIRWECVFRRQRAHAFLLQLLGSCSIGKSFFGVINNYINFIDPDSIRKNKSRAVLQPWFKRFLNNARKIRLYSKKPMLPSAERNRDWLIRQTVPAFAVWLGTYGASDIQNELLRAYKDGRFKAKHQYLIDDFRARAGAPPPDPHDPSYTDIFGTVLLKGS